MLEKAWNNARSFTQKDRPDDLRLIGTITKGFPNGNKEFVFYRDSRGEYWYESKSTDKKLPV